MLTLNTYFNWYFERHLRAFSTKSYLCFLAFAKTARFTLKTHLDERG